MKILIRNHAVQVNDYSAYYNRVMSPFAYQETFDASRGRTKTAKLMLYNFDGTMIPPLEDQAVNIFRTVAGADLLFGGVITQVNAIPITKIDSLWVTAYDLKLAGYDPQTLNYAEVTAYERIDTKAGQIIKDLITKYAPWIDPSGIQVPNSQVIKRIKINRLPLVNVINAILEKTGWTFYVDDNARALFNSPVNLSMNWGLTEGTNPDYFKEFEPDSLQIESNVEQNANNVTLLGGVGRGSKVVETFVFNGHDINKPLTTIPYGLEQTIQIFDPFDQPALDLGKWYEEDTGNKITETQGRLQINSGVNGTGIIVSNDLFSREDNCEIRMAEVQLVSFTSGKMTVGVHNGTKDTVITNFIHAFEFDQAAGTLHVREGATVTNLPAVPIGAGVYQIKIIVKASGGAKYFIQGGRTATSKELGELGSSNWILIMESSANTASAMAIAVRADLAIGATAIRYKVSKEIDVRVTAKAGTIMGTTTFAVDTQLVCGVEGALDFETDCFISVADQNPVIGFFTDNNPIGRIEVRYYSIEDIVRERVYDSTNIANVAARSALPGDLGYRTRTLDRQDFVLSSQDARDLLAAYLADKATVRYRGKFTTDTFRLAHLSPVGEKPVAGKMINITLPNTFRINSTELITEVSGQDIGGEIFKFDVSFGEGRLSFDRLLLKLRANSLEEIVDTDDLAAVGVTFDDLAAATNPRVPSPEFGTAVFDANGIALTWPVAPGATYYEVRDNLYVRQGQGGSLVFQVANVNTYNISVADIRNLHRKRKFTFYIWSITIDGLVSKYPLIITVENPAPVPQPIRDITNPNGLAISIRFAPEVEPDVLPTGRNLQISVNRAMTGLVVSSDISKTVESYEYTGATDTIYYIRYGLEDDYTNYFNDILYSGIREVKTGAGDFSGTKQFLSNAPPDNATTGLTMSSAVNGAGDSTVTYTFNYTQGFNVATHFALTFKIGGGSPTFADPSILVPARNGSSLQYKHQMPTGAMVSFAVIPVAVVRGGSVPAGAYQSFINHLVGGVGDTQYVHSIPGTSPALSYTGTGIFQILSNQGELYIAADDKITFQTGTGNPIYFVPGGPVVMQCDLQIHATLGNFFPRREDSATQPTLKFAEMRLWRNSSNGTVWLLWNEPTVGVMRIQFT